MAGKHKASSLPVDEVPDGDDCQEAADHKESVGLHARQALPAQAVVAQGAGRAHPSAVLDRAQPRRVRPHDPQELAVDGVLMPIHQVMPTHQGSGSSVLRDVALDEVRGAVGRVDAHPERRAADGKRRLVAVCFGEVHEAPVSPVALGSVGGVAPPFADRSLGAAEAGLPELSVAAVGPGAAAAAFAGPHPSAVRDGVGGAGVARGGGAAYLKTC